MRVTKINSILQWITAGLYGGYVAPNFLKWYWWRLNAVGYFAGMVSGTALAIFQISFKDLGILPAEPLYAFPFIFAVSAVCTVVASLLTSPESEETLKSFYISVRPWGFWGPVHQLCLSDDASIQPNRAFGRDMFNCLIGTIWQTAIIVLPIYLVLRMSTEATIAGTVVVIATLILKFNWFDKLDSSFDE
jgi:Na+/proline symporter